MRGTRSNLPPVHIRCDDILHRSNVLLDLLVDALAPLRQISLGEIPLAISIFEKDIDLIVGLLRRHAVMSVISYEVLSDSIGLQTGGEQCDLMNSIVVPYQLFGKG